MSRSVPTEAEREAAFQRYLELNVPYVAAIEANGNEPWHGNDIAARRELFFRRWTKPAPPADLHTPNVKDNAA